ncbi:MAG: nitroreductase family protein [Acidobacteriaceae bacterium]
MKQQEAYAPLFDQVTKERQSVRGFLSREVPEPDLREVFALAQQAPSNCNVQPWVVHVASGASAHALRDKLVAAAQVLEDMHPDWPVDVKYAGVYRDRQHDAAAKLYGAMGIERKDLAGRNYAFMRNFSFFAAPHAAFIFMHADFDIRQAADCGMYAQTLMLTLQI